MKKLVVLTAVLAALVAPTVSRAAVPVVYVQNDSTLLTNEQVHVELNAFQISVSRDLAPAWGTDAVLTDDPAQASSASMVIDVKDDADVLGALGYHEVVNDIPTSYVFVDTSQADGVAWQLVFSHELDEMLVDPWITRAQLGNLRKWWLVEVADPVEATRFSYHINGVQISDFILPSWYTGGRGPFDFTRALKRRGQIAVGGYACYWQFGSWKAIDGPFSRETRLWGDGR